MNSDNYDFKKYTIQSISDYIKVIKEIKSLEKEEVWLRGQFKASNRLLPSAMREKYSLCDQFGEKIHPSDEKGRGETVAFLPYQAMLRDFKSLAMEQFGELIRIEPKNDLEWLFLAQHYGIPTTLLDWTTDPLVALFFATQGTPDRSLYISPKEAIQDFHDNSYTEYGAAIYIINPQKVNEETSEVVWEKNNEKMTDVLNIADEKHYGIFKAFIDQSDNYFNFPLCTLGGELDRRICRQSGNFTIHGTQVRSLDDYNILRKSMYKIFIPYKCFNEVKEVLDTLNINETSIYGDGKLQNLVRGISQKGKEDFNSGLLDILRTYQK
ncbi:FRG domain-containing protein [Paenibacillus sp. FSL H8-0104]|uniref:FRG domain-containing protein n=1 Tax=Paenibacillus sp. FSL H8-0104 TaxID=2954509 RepID=UPI0030FD7F51